MNQRDPRRPAARRGFLPLLSLCLALCVSLSACGDKASEGDGATQPADNPASTTDPVAGSGAKSTGRPATLPAAPEPDPNKVIVTVDGEDVTQADLDKELQAMVFGGRPVDSAQMAMVRQRFGSQAEKSLVDRKLIENAAAKEGIVATPEDVAARWEKIESSFPEGMDRDTLLQRNKMTLEDANQRIAEAICIERVLKKHLPQAPVTDEAVRKKYDANLAAYKVPEQVQARHILIKVPSGATDEQKAAVKKKMDDIRAKLVAAEGKNFAELAAKYSDCPSKKQGGDLGLFGRGAMVPEFDQQAFTLKPGVISEPFTTSFGYHIMEVVKKQPARTQSFDEVKGKIRLALESAVQRKGHEAFIAELRKAAKIEHPGVDSDGDAAQDEQPTGKAAGSAAK